MKKIATVFIIGNKCVAVGRAGACWFNISGGKERKGGIRNLESECNSIPRLKEGRKEGRKA